MTNFLEKLKKGMGSTYSSQKKNEEPEEIEETEEEKPSKIPSRKKTTTKKAKDKTMEIVRPDDLNFVEKKDEILDKVFPNQVKEALAEEAEETEEEIPKPVSSAAVKKEPISVFSEKALQDNKKNWFDQEGQLTVDVYETDREIVVRSAIAGVKPEDLDISIENEVLLIKGKREEHKEEKIKDYFYQECYWGKFSREIVLPEEVDPSKVEAVMKDGILTVRIPKIKKGKKISISEE